MPNDDTRRYLRKIATVVEGYPTMRPKAMQAWMSLVATPAQVVTHAANDVPTEHREAVLRVLNALPLIGTTDFAQAARQIRQAAGPCAREARHLGSRLTRRDGVSGGASGRGR